MPRHPPRRTLPAVIDYFAETAPRSDALVCGMRRFPYGELRSAVVQVAAGLARLGVGSGDSVAILMGNRAEWVITSVAAGALGATVVAVNTWWTQHEIEYALTHSAASLLVCDVRYMRHDYATIIETLRRDGRLSKLRAVVGVEVGGPLPDSWIAWDWLRQSGVGSDLPLKPDPEGIAYVLYTSGSTSAPKGVQLRHGDLVTNTWHIGQRLGLGRHDRLWLAVSLFWGFGCSNAMPAILCDGGWLVLQVCVEAAEALALLVRDSGTG
ncbi:MAG: AMP-binding protein, partial [Pigmentiphaga sp.]